MPLSVRAFRRAFQPVCRIILDDVVGVNLFQKIIHVGTDELVTVHDIEQAAEG